MFNSFFTPLTDAAQETSPAEGNIGSRCCTITILQCGLFYYASV
jgi:hypothetical protein